MFTLWLAYVEGPLVALRDIVTVGFIGTAVTVAAGCVSLLLPSGAEPVRPAPAAPPNEPVEEHPATIEAYEAYAASIDQGIAARYADIIRHAEPHGRAVYVPSWAVDAYISELDVTWSAPADRRPLWLATLPPIRQADPEPADDMSTPLADAVEDRLQLAGAVA